MGKMKQTTKKTLTLKTLTKSNVWEMQENDIFRMWEVAERDVELKENLPHYRSIIQTAFDFEPITVDKPEVIKKYEARGYQVGQMKLSDGDKAKWAIKKKAILRITDLTHDNIHHISAIKLIEVLERNFGCGWESLPQNVKDIIESGFEVSTTTLPADRLKKKGGLYDKMVKDGYEVLEIPQGTWIEAIFVKQKPKVEQPQLKPETQEKHTHTNFDDEDSDEDLPEIDDRYDEDEDDDDEFDDDKLTEESYRTTFETNPEDLDLESADVSDDEDY